MVTAALGTTAPEESETVPLILPFTVCPLTLKQANAAIRRAPQICMSGEKNWGRDLGSCIEVTPPNFG
jgi:hypothetical protein